MKEKYFDVIILGGGAAGFFAACQLANTNLKVCIVEKTSKTLSKVKISGGGRCNVTHNVNYSSDLVKHYPNGKNFLKKVFKHFNAQDTLSWFKDRGVAIVAEADGRMFPVSNDSQTIIDTLTKESLRKGVELISNFQVSNIGKAEFFEVESKEAELLQSKYLLIATGGYPKLFQFQWLEKLGHSIHPPVPSLFTFNIPTDSLSHLQGLSVNNAKVNIVGEKLSYEGPLLITHWGISGPAVLKLSAWGSRILNERAYEFDVSINWLAELTEDAIRQNIQAFQTNHPLKSVLSNALFELPKRLWEEIMIRSGVKEIHNFGDIGSKTINRMVENLFRMKLSAKGKTTYKEEFVTSGGVQLDEVDANSMESKLVPRVYFAGEVLDIDGITGGFNFQAAWSTAYLASKSIMKESDS